MSDVIAPQSPVHSVDEPVATAKPRKFPGLPLDLDSAGGLVLCLQATLLSHPRLVDAASAFAVELAQALQCDRASVGLVRNGSAHLIADSGGREIVAKSPAATAIAAAMNEAFDQKAILVHPVPAGALSLITVAHQRLATGSGGTCSIPLMNAGRIAGILTLERNLTPFQDWEVAHAEDAACFAGPLFELKNEAERPWWSRLGARLRERIAALATPGNAGTKLAFFGVLMLFAAATLVPLPWRISAPARLESSVQRAIVAPADGYLRQANVRAGDRVKAGQVLAELAGEDMQLEHTRRENELRQHENAYRTALARADRAQMVIHQARAGEAQAMLDLVDGQLERARIQAPFDGLVIKGDLSQSLGAPVSRGEVLFTIAPGDSFRLIVEVDEADIGGISAGQQGKLALAANPDKLLEFTVRRIVPAATAGEARNYFEVEAELPASGLALRPGLRGVAKIEAGERNMWWILTHRPLGWLRVWLWSQGL